MALNFTYGSGREGCLQIQHTIFKVLHPKVGLPLQPRHIILVLVENDRGIKAIVEARRSLNLLTPVIECIH